MTTRSVLANQLKKLLDRTARQPADVGGVRHGLAGDLRQRRLGAGGEIADERAIGRLVLREISQQSVEQNGVAARTNRQMQIGALACRRPARVDDDDAASGISRLRRQHALVEDGMAPGRIGSDKDQQVGLFQIFIATRNGVAAEGALVAHHAGGHAQPRIGIDIGGADKALRELVDDVVILGEKLARDVEGHRIRPVLPDRLAESIGYMAKRGIPGRRPSVDHGLEQASFETDGFSQRRSFRAQPPEICRMKRITADGDGARGIPVGHDAAADAAIGTGRLDCHAWLPSIGGSGRGLTNATATPCRSPPWSDASACIPRPERPPRRSQAR